jgi:hypothetical protein
MPRTKKAAAVAAQATDAALDTAPASTPAAEQAPAGDVGRETRQPAREPTARETAYAADPHEKISVSLSDVRGGPSMHLLRSHRFNQMQVRFDGEQPNEKHLQKLKDAGWKDRTQEEGVLTKQIDKDARWQSVAKMEEEFKAVANAIRKEKGLEPALEGLGA